MASVTVYHFQDNSYLPGITRIGHFAIRITISGLTETFEVNIGPRDTRFQTWPNPPTLSSEPSPLPPPGGSGGILRVITEADLQARTYTQVEIPVAFDHETTLGNVYNDLMGLLRSYEERGQLPPISYAPLAHIQDGINCASFVYTVLEAAGVDMIDYL
jgi:hypothetical protein